MDKKLLHEFKEAKKKVSEGSLALWNARLDALAHAGRDKDLMAYLMRDRDTIIIDDPINPTDSNCPCEEGGQRIINVFCPPDCPEPPDPPDDDGPDPDPIENVLGRVIDERFKEMLINERFKEMSGTINLIKKDLDDIRNRLK